MFSSKLNSFNPIIGFDLPSKALLWSHLWEEILNFALDTHQFLYFHSTSFFLLKLERIFTVNSLLQSLWSLALLQGKNFPHIISFFIALGSAKLFSTTFLANIPKCDPANIAAFQPSQTNNIPNHHPNHTSWNRKKLAQTAFLPNKLGRKVSKSWQFLLQQNCENHKYLINFVTQCKLNSIRGPTVHFFRVHS